MGNFYLTPTRAWELALGSLLAMGAMHGFLRTPPLGVGKRNLITIVALAMIILPMMFFNQNTRFPGLNALPPTVGTALVIAFARDDTVVGRFLSWRWVVGLGLLSYSVYLWHQPLFAFARLYSTENPAPWVFGVLGLASIVLAYVSWRFVERPFRDRRRFKRRQIFAMALAGSFAFCAIGLVGHFGEGLPGRLKLDQQRILAFGDRAENRSEGLPGPGCMLEPGQGAAALGQCVENPVAAGPSVLLWGDSHAAHLYSGLSRKLAGASRFTYLTASACPPFLSIDVVSGAACLEANRAILERITHERPNRVILAAVWGNYEWTALAGTLDALKAAGIAQVQVVGPVPRWHPSLPIVLTRFGVSFVDLPDRIRLGLDPATRQLDLDMKRFVADRGASYISPYTILCNADGCLIRTGTEIASMMQWDVSHLTRRGSEFLVSRFPRE